MIAMVSHRISTARAHLASSDEMARFLSQIPNSDSLSAVLQGKQTVSTRAYDDDAEVARFVCSDGTEVTCLAVAGVTIDEAEMIAAQLELLKEWSDDGLLDAVHLALADDVVPYAGGAAL